MVFAGGAAFTLIPAFSGILDSMALILSYL
jgi:hypothetical protein